MEVPTDQQTSDVAPMEDDFTTEKAFPKSLLTDYYSDSSGSDDEEVDKPNLLQPPYGRRDSGEEVHLPLNAATAVSVKSDPLPSPPRIYTSVSSTPDQMSNSTGSSLAPSSDSLSLSNNLPSTVVTAAPATTTTTSVSSISQRILSSQQLQPENIKITPSLTSVLSDIFPQLSKTLEDKRKRKLDDRGSGLGTAANNSTSLLTGVTKSPRIDVAASLANVKVGATPPPVVVGSIGAVTKPPRIDVAASLANIVGATPPPVVGSLSDNPVDLPPPSIDQLPTDVEVKAFSDVPHEQHSYTHDQPLPPHSHLDNSEYLSSPPFPQGPTFYDFPPPFPRPPGFFRPPYGHHPQFSRPPRTPPFSSRPPHVYRPYRPGRGAPHIRPYYH